jgi:copper chaperone CopZ
MKRVATILGVAVLTLGLAATSWAGGASCSGDGAKSSSATLSSGGHCSGDAEHTMAAKECAGVQAGQVMYSFSVPAVECEACVNSIQKTAMTTKGIQCAHVDLSTRTAYVIADKKLSKQQVSKMLTEAGFKNKFTAEGKNAQAAFTKAIASGDKAVNECCAKGKDKV